MESKPMRKESERLETGTRVKLVSGGPDMVWLGGATDSSADCGWFDKNGVFQKVEFSRDVVRSLECYYQLRDVLRDHEMDRMVKRFASIL